MVCEQWTQSGWTAVDSVRLTQTRILSECAGIGCPERSKQCCPTKELVKQLQVVAFWQCQVFESHPDNDINDVLLHSVTMVT